MFAASVGGSEAAGPSRRPPPTSLVESRFDVCPHERSTAPASRRFRWPWFAARGHWRRRGRLAVYEIRTLIIARLSLVSSNRSIAHLIRKNYIVITIVTIIIIIISSSSSITWLKWHHHKEMGTFHRASLLEINETFAKLTMCKWRNVYFELSQTQ